MFEHYRGFAVCEPHAATQPKLRTVPFGRQVTGKSGQQLETLKLTDPARHTAGSHVKSVRVKSPPSEGGGSLRLKKARIRLGSH